MQLISQRGEVKSEQVILKDVGVVCLGEQGSVFPESAHSVSLIFWFGLGFFILFSVSACSSCF